MKYIQIPKTITYKDLAQKCSLSPNSYRVVLLKNRNSIPIIKLLEEAPVKGKEVGSEAYVNKSPYFFMRTQAVSDANFILEFNLDSFVPIKEKDFQNAYKNNPNKLVKVGDIFYVKGGNVGAVGIADRDFKAIFSSHIFKLKINKELRYYVFAILKNQFSKAQMLNLPIGAIGGLDTFKLEYFEEITIPFPVQKNKAEIIEFVSLLTKAVIRKEAEVERKYNGIMNLIDEEFKENQKGNEFVYYPPSLEDLQEGGRLDAGMFCWDYKEKQFMIENYAHGAENIFNYGFDFKRGQNLQVSQIGRSIYTDEYKPNFYKLIRPLNLSDFGTVEKYEYLGNPRKLQTVNGGEILFSAEGTIGKFHVFVDVDKKTITNIHGLIIFRKHRKNDLESVFLGLFLGYLRVVGILDYISVGGQGGSLAQKYWKYVKIPKFPHSKKEELAKYYHNPPDYDKNKLNFREFEREDLKITKKSGIIQLDTQIKVIKEELDRIVQKIVLDEEVLVSFNFLKSLIRH